EQYGKVGGIAVRRHQVQVSVAIDIRGEERYRRRPDLVRYPRPKGPITTAHEHKQVMARVADDGQIRDSAAVEIGQDRSLGIGLAVPRIGQIFLEFAVPQAQQNRNIMGAAVAGSEVELSVAVEVAGHEAQGLESSSVTCFFLKGAISVAQE